MPASNVTPPDSHLWYHPCLLAMGWWEGRRTTKRKQLKNTDLILVLCYLWRINTRLPCVSQFVYSPPACWVSGPMGKPFSPLPRKHVCIPSMLPCFCLYGNLSTGLLTHQPCMPPTPAPSSGSVNSLKLCVVFLFFFLETGMLCMCRLL